MKRILISAALVASIGANSALAGNLNKAKVEPPLMKPQVVTTAATKPASEGYLVPLLLLGIVLAAVLSGPSHAAAGPA